MAEIIGEIYLVPGGEGRAQVGVAVNQSTTRGTSEVPVIVQVTCTSNHTVQVL